MGRGRKFNKKPKTRPKKAPSARRRRDTVQKRRLAARGVPEEKLRRMNTAQIRRMLGRPAEKTGDAGPASSDSSSS